jgi:malonyl-CoA/methylmalonyl-CoA synthetase
MVVAHIAALRLGLVVVPANTAYRKAEIAHLINDARPAAAVIGDDEARGWVSELAPGAVVVGPDVDLPPGPVPRMDQAAAADPAMIGYTSGTTGRPKGAVLTHGNLLAGVEAVRLAWRWTAADRLILALPLFHMHGLGVGLHGTLVTGGSAVLLPRFDADEVIASVAGEQATMFFGVPTMYSRLVEAEGAAALGALRLCVSGSAPLDPDLHRRMFERTGQVVLERYGMTETVMLVSNPYEGERRPGSVGWPLPGVELRLRGDGDTGEILVKGPNVFAGYWDRPEATAEAFDAGGWFATGDIGRWEDGYLRIVGRQKELIISGGFNVYPREVEDVLVAHPGVAEAAVVGMPSAEWGEIVVAAVVRAPGDHTESDLLMAWCRDRLAPFKCPRRVSFVAALPRNALGKVLRDQVTATWR